MAQKTPRIDATSIVVKAGITFTVGQASFKVTNHRNPKTKVWIVEQTIKGKGRRKEQIIRLIPMSESDIQKSILTTLKNARMNRSETGHYLPCDYSKNNTKPPVVKTEPVAVSSNAKKAAFVAFIFMTRRVRKQPNPLNRICIAR